MKKIAYIFLVLFLGIASTLSAQTPQKQHTLSEKINTSSHYVARDYILLTNGFSANSADGITFSAKINPFLVFAPTNGTYAKPDGTIVNSATEGGVVGSIAGQFNVGATGGATYAIPIECPVGVKGMTPNISVVYNSQGGNSIVGWGWNIAGLSSISKVPKSIYYDGSGDKLNWSDERTLSLDGIRLLTSNGTDYYAENDPSIKITRKSSNGSYFEVKFKNGITATYQTRHYLKRTTSGSGGNYFNAWQITKQVNPNGSYVKFYYTSENQGSSGGYYIKKNNCISYITYGHATSGDVGRVTFNYKTRTDKISKYISGCNYLQEKILDNIQVSSMNQPYRTYSFTYAQSNSFNKLQKITLKNSAGEKYNPTEIVWESSPGSYPHVGSNYIANISEKRTARPVYGDFNGDGMTDFYTYKDGNVVLFLAYSYYGDIGFSKKYSFKTYGDKPKGVVPADLNGDGKIDLVSITEAGNGTYQYNFYFFDGEKFTNGRPSGEYYGFNTTKRNGDILIGDFNGDGKHNVLIKSTQKVYNQYGSVIATGGIASWGNETLVPFINNKYLVDFTGNGKTNLCILGSSNATVYELQGSKFVKKFTIPELSYITPGLVGDYNGDNLTDFLVQTNDSKNYFFLLSNGNGFTKKTLPNLNLYNKTFITDFNRDGKSDFVVCGKYNTSTKKYIFRLGISTGSGFRFEEVSSQINLFSGNGGLYFWNYMHFADFNGDGRTDLCYDRYSDVMQFKSFTDKDNLLVHKIKDGMGEATSITYSKLNDRAVYSESASKPSFPLINYKLSLDLVSRVTTTGSQYQHTSYKYKDIRMHKQGKGLLGFLSHTMNNSTLKLKIETTNTLNTSYYVLLPKEVKKSSSNKEVSITTQNYSVGYGGGSKRFKIRLSNQQDQNKLSGVITKKTYSGYDTYGNPGSILTEFFKGSVNSGISEKQSFTYTTKGAWCTNLPETIAIVKKNGSESQTRKSSFAYDTKGNVTKTTKDIGTTNQVVTYYKSFDSFGNPRTIEKVANGKTRSTAFEYTTTGRFIKKKTNKATGFYTVYNFDEIKGVVNYSTDHLGLKVSHTYDGFNRKTQTQLPDGTLSATALRWAGNDGPSGAKFYAYSETSGKSPTWTWSDGLGRELRTESYGFNMTKKVRIDKQYNSKGQLYQTFKPYFEGETRRTNFIYAYDDYGRNTSVSSSDHGTTKKEYNGLTISVTSPTGTKSETFNAAGQLMTSTINGRSVRHSYWPSGQIKTSTPQGGVAVKTYFDEQGNRTKLIDPDAGITDSKYNGFGELLWTQHSKSELNGTTKTIKTVFEYDDAGRKKKLTRGSDVTNYDYNANGFLAKEWNSKHSITYKYDEGKNLKQGLLTSRTENIDSKSFTFGIEYDSYGRNAKKTYPSGFYTKNTYNKYGYLLEITDKSGNRIWKAQNLNIYGQITEELKGNKRVSYSYDDRNRIESINVAGVMSQSYRFNDKSNLEHRSFTYGSDKQEETFTYDDQNQLTKWKTSSSAVTGNNFAAYDIHGNITSRNIDGNNTAYSLNYDDPTKVHAITSISGNPTKISDEEQLLTYTDFNKVETLKEGNKSLSLTYGIGNQRRIATFEQGSNKTTHYYLGDYEEKRSNGKIKKVHYISGGSGIAAIYVEENGSGKLYYAHTDHQGSLVTLTNTSGNIVEKYAYDPWGRRRNPDNWKLFDTRTNFIVDRGYTMHEHLDRFALINMNGRVYDPALGRFVSPDPHIQAPGIWLNYNRYAYCFNNPLIYTDPTGEYALIDDLIVMGVGGLINLGVNAIQGNVNSWGEAGGYFVSGAIAAEVTIYAGPVAGGAVLGVGNDLTSQLGQKSRGEIESVNWSQTMFSGFMGGATAYVGGQITSTITPHISGFMSNITSSPVIQQSLTQGISNATSGFTLGTGVSLLNGNDFQTALGDGGRGALFGGGLGLTTGAISGYSYAKDNNIHWRTGKSLSPKPDFTVTPDGIVLPRGANIPDDLVPNPYGRPGSYGQIIDGKFVETLRIDPPTAPGYKGPNQSHFHLNGGKKHIFDISKWPSWNN